MSEWILEAQSLHYHYPCGKTALNRLDLRIARGTRLAVLGANGAGKTTLFLCLNGLLRPQSGSLQVNGSPVGYSKRDLLAWRQRVGLVFQNPDDQVVGGNVLQDVAFGPLNLGLPPEAARQRAYEALDVLSLGGLRDMPTHELSFGMRKLVAIAGVLAMRPEVIVLDEPTAGIDPEGAQQVLKALAAVQRQGTALVISTHDMDLAWEWADEVAVLVDGRTARQGTVTDIFADTALLHQARLRQPWLPEIIAHLQAAGALPTTLAIPRSRAALAAAFAELAKTC
jgi:cobalt/nickel transport system ATP-binding protein